jgi:hypothetical protein
MEKLKETTKSRPSTSSSLTATNKCRAVLSVWTEKRKPSEICKELGVNWTVLMHWQNRAMEGMLQALEPRINLEKGVALSPKLQVMLAQREKNLLVQSALKPGNRLEARLANIAAKATKTELRPPEITKIQQKE